MIQNVKYNIYSIIESIIGKEIDGNKKISELVLTEPYLKNDIINTLQDHYNISINDIEQKSINELFSSINEYEDINNIDKILFQQFLIFCEKYSTCKPVDVLKFLESLQISKEYIPELIDKCINVKYIERENSKYRYWWIYMCIDFYKENDIVLNEILKRYDKSINVDKPPENTSECNSEMESIEPIEYIENIYTLNTESFYDKNNIKIYNSNWNWCRQNIFEIEKTDLQNNELMHINIINKLDSNSYKFLKYRFNNDVEYITNLVNDDPYYKHFISITDPIITINNKGYIMYDEINKSIESDIFERCIDLIQFKTANEEIYKVDETYTKEYQTILRNIYKNGISNIDKNIVILDIEHSDIVVELLKTFLMCGCNIIIGINQVNNKELQNKNLEFDLIYKKYGAKKSKLTAIPLNINNNTDIKDFIDYCTEYYNDIIDVFVPIFYQVNIKNNINNEQVIRFIYYLAEKYKKKHVLGKYTKIFMPFLTNIEYFKNNYNCSEISNINKQLYKINKIYKKYFLFVSINLGWIRDSIYIRNRIISPDLEKKKIITLNASNIPIYILTLLHPTIMNIYSSDLMINLDISFNLYTNTNLYEYMEQKEEEVYNTANFNKLLHRYKKHDLLKENKYFKERYRFKTHFPKIDESRYNDLNNMRNIPIDRSNVIVIVGFGENSYKGNVRTRLESESGDISIETCIELCWYMGIIKYDKQNGWFEVETEIQISEYDIYIKYEKYIIEILNIKIEKNTKHLYNPLTLENDIIDIPLRNDEDEEYLKNKYNNNVDFYSKDGNNYATIKKGSDIVIVNSINNISGKNTSYTNNAKIYGIPDEFLAEIDNDVLYTIIAASEALISAGISDPYEIYQYISMGDVGTVIGQGMKNIINTEKEFDEKAVISKTISYWINKVLINFQGPTKIPDSSYNAYAMSLEMGVELLQQQKAKIVFVGSNETAGISPKYEDKLKHPFQENMSSILIITTATIAINMGLPIYGICSYVHSSLKLLELNNILNSTNKKKKDFLDWTNRRKTLNHVLKKIDNGATDLINHIIKYYGHEFYKSDDKVSHITGVLSTWGLTIDDIMLSVYNNYNHNRKISDSSIIQKQMDYLDRSPGNLLPIIMPDFDICNNSCSFGLLLNSLLQSFQTGEVIIKNKLPNLNSKLSSNSCIFYPEGKMHFSFLKTILLKNISEDNNTCVELLLIHPDYLISTLQKNEINTYKQKLNKRKYINFRIWNSVLYNERSLIHFKKNNTSDNMHTHSYLDILLKNQLLNNKLSDINKKDYINIIIKKIEFENENFMMHKTDLAQIFQLYSKEKISNNCRGIGIDIKLNKEIDIVDKKKYSEIFTDNEIENYAQCGENMDILSYIWTSKESIIKAIGSVLKHENHNIVLTNKEFKNIEIIHDNNISVVKLYNNLDNIICKLKVTDITITINYSKIYSFVHTVIT